MQQLASKLARKDYLLYAPIMDWVAYQSYEPQCQVPSAAHLEKNSIKEPLTLDEAEISQINSHEAGMDLFSFKQIFLCFALLSDTPAKTQTNSL